MTKPHPPDIAFDTEQAGPELPVVPQLAASHEATVVVGGDSARRGASGKSIHVSAPDATPSPADFCTEVESCPGWHRRQSPGRCFDRHIGGVGASKRCGK